MPTTRIRAKKTRAKPRTAAWAMHELDGGDVRILLRQVGKRFLADIVPFCKDLEIEATTNAGAKREALDRAKKLLEEAAATLEHSPWRMRVARRGR